MKKEWKRKYAIILMLIEVIFLGVLTGLILFRKGMVVDVDISAWGSNYIDFDNEWYVDENILKTEDTIDIICGPYIDLKRGTYSVMVEYECDHDQSCLVYANAGKDIFLDTEVRKLRCDQKNASFDFALTKDIDNFEVVVKYDGKGFLSIKNIEIKPEIVTIQRILIAVLLFFFILDMVLYIYQKGKRIQLLWLLEIGGIFFLIALIIVRSRTNDKIIDASIDEWDSQYVEYNDGWYIDESIAESNSTKKSGVLDLLCGPRIPLKKGTYSVRIGYECDEDQSCFAYADYVYKTYIKTGVNQLSRNQTNASFDFTLTEDIDNFEVIVQYNGKGKFKINDIEISRNTIGLHRILAVFILLSICIDLCFCFRTYIDSNRQLILKLCGIILLASLPLFVRGIGSGQDMMFHFMRIEGIAEELRRGNIPVKLSSLWMDGYGYPVSVFYGDILLYIPAVMRIIGFPIVTSYKFYVFLINFGTVLISYGCFKRIFGREDLAVLTSLAYATAGYRVVCIYVRAALGEYSAMMFFPLIMLAVCRLYTAEDEGWKFYRKYAFVLALGMSGVIGTHILSTEMVVITLIMLCIVLWKRTFRRKVLCAYLLAVAETVALNLYFVIPFLDFFTNMQVSVNYAPDDIKIIQAQGAYIGQYFAFFQNMFGMSEINLSARMNLSPGLLLMLILGVTVVLWVNNRATKEMKFYFLFSVVLLFMASNLFPWDHLGLHYRMGKIISQVQFPWRYLGIAIPFLIMLMGNVFKLTEMDEEKSKRLSAIIVCICMLMGFFYVSDYSNSAAMRYYYDTLELDTYAYGGGEYLRAWTDTDSFTGDTAWENMREVSVLSRNGTYMELYCEASDADGTVELPLLNYKGYQVTDEYGKEYEITDGENNVIQFSVPSGFKGKITVDFVEPWLWRAGEIGSLLTIIFFCAAGGKSACMARYARRNEGL